MREYIEKRLREAGLLHGEAMKCSHCQKLVDEVLAMIEEDRMRQSEVFS